jgi:hypothetical protein
LIQKTEQKPNLLMPHSQADKIGLIFPYWIAQHKVGGKGKTEFLSGKQTAGMMKVIGYTLLVIRENDF